MGTAKAADSPPPQHQVRISPCSLQTLQTLLKLTGSCAHMQKLQEQALSMARADRVAAACSYVLALYLGFVRGLLLKLPLLDFCICLATLGCSFAYAWAASSLDDKCASSLVPDLDGKTADARSSWPREDPAARRRAERWWCCLAGWQAVCIVAQLGTVLYLLTQLRGSAPVLLLINMAMYACTVPVQLFALSRRWQAGLPRMAASARFLLAAKSSFLAQSWPWPEWEKHLRPEVFAIQGIQQDLQHQFTSFVIQQPWRSFVGVIAACDASNTAFSEAVEGKDQQRKLAALLAYVCSPKAWRAVFSLAHLVESIGNTDKQHAHNACETLWQLLELQKEVFMQLSRKELKKLLTQLCKCCNNFAGTPPYASPAPARALAALVSCLGPVRVRKICSEVDAPELEASLVRMVTVDRGSIKYTRQRVWAAFLPWQLYCSALTEQEWQTCVLAIDGALRIFLADSSTPDRWSLSHNENTYYVYTADRGVFYPSFGHIVAAAP